MARAFVRVNAPADAVAEFYDSVEDMLCVSPSLNEILSSVDLALLAHAFALHRRPRPLLTEETDEEACPIVKWRFDEEASRRFRDFTPQGLGLILFAAARLQTAEHTFFNTLFSQIRSKHQALSGRSLALIFRAAIEAVPVISLSPVLSLVRDLQPDCRRLMPAMHVSNLADIMEALHAAALARRSLGGAKSLIWRNQGKLKAILRQALKSAGTYPPWRSQDADSVRKHVQLIAEMEGFREGELEALMGRCIEDKHPTVKSLGDPKMNTRQDASGRSHSQ